MGLGLESGKPTRDIPYSGTYLRDLDDIKVTMMREVAVERLPWKPQQIEMLEAEFWEYFRNPQCPEDGKKTVGEDEERKVGDGKAGANSVPTWLYEKWQ